MNNIDELITPCYIINEAEYEKNIQELMQAYESRWPGKVEYGYSVKTNHFPLMLKKALEYGWHAEVVSPDEYEFALSCGAEKGQIIYNGPQKRETVLSAIREGSLVNLDNLQEVELICRALDETEKKQAKVGIRVNFDLEKECPGETTCKGIVGRFGICYENGDVKRAIDTLQQAKIKVRGLHLHSSSSSRSRGIFRAISEKACEVMEKYQLTDLEYIDVGGGFFGGNYFPGKPTVQEYAETITDVLKERLDRPEEITLLLEPGAAVLATSMDYLVSVLNEREIRGKRVITVDGSLLHINPMMNPHETPFEMLHPGEETEEEQIIGGSTCMEMDRFLPRGLKNRVLPESKLRFFCCGAYMSTHNSSFINAAPNIYLYEDGEYRLVREKKPIQMMEY